MYFGEDLPDVSVFDDGDIYDLEFVVSSGKTEILDYEARKNWANEYFEVFNHHSKLHSGSPKSIIHLYGYIRYRSVFGTEDEVGFYFEYLKDLDAFLDVDKPGYKYRKRNGEVR